MEATLQTPSIESFSYSWLANAIDPSDHDEASFIEMDPRLPPSKRFIRVSSDFSFDFPISDSPLGLVHADELISNGFLIPLFTKEMKTDAFEAEIKTMRPTSRSRVRCASLRRCHRLSKRFFQKYLKFLFRPLFQTRRREAVSWEVSAETSPRTSGACSGDDTWRRSCDSESSIYEAVLHCKRTQGK